MQKKTDQENNAKDIFKCPHCKCCFCTDADLKKHIAVYGESKMEHFEEFQKTHARLEHGSPNVSE